MGFLLTSHRLSAKIKWQIAILLLTSGKRKATTIKAEKIAIGSDHAGFELKEAIKQFLLSSNCEAIDVGAYSTESVDYPDYASKIGDMVSHGKVAKAILICATGIGMSIAVNRFPRVRGALCDNTFTASLSRQHNDANVLVLGARITAKDLAQEIVKVWLDTPFSGGRHSRRIDKIEKLNPLTPPSPSLGREAYVRGPKEIPKR